MAGAAKALGLVKNTGLQAVPFDANNKHAPSSNTAAVVTVAADANRPIALKQIFLSYDATPTGGSIQVEDGATLVWGPFAVSTATFQVVTFDPPLMGTKNTAMTITLAAGGNNVTGKLAVTPLVFGG